MTNELLLGALQNRVEDFDLSFHDVPLRVESVVELEEPLKLGRLSRLLVSLEWIDFLFM